MACSTRKSPTRTPPRRRASSAARDAGVRGVEDAAVQRAELLAAGVEAAVVLRIHLQGDAAALGVGGRQPRRALIRRAVEARTLEERVQVAVRGTDLGAHDVPRQGGGDVGPRVAAVVRTEERRVVRLRVIEDLAAGEERPGGGIAGDGPDDHARRAVAELLVQRQAAAEGADPDAAVGDVVVAERADVERVSRDLQRGDGFGEGPDASRSCRCHGSGRAAGRWWRTRAAAGSARAAARRCCRSGSWSSSGRGSWSDRGRRSSPRTTRRCSTDRPRCAGCTGRSAGARCYPS
jgi:hypothetical protein